MLSRILTPRACQEITGRDRSRNIHLEAAGRLLTNCQLVFWKSGSWGGGSCVGPSENRLKLIWLSSCTSIQFAAVMVLTLAVSIGANSAIFSVIEFSPGGTAEGCSGLCRGQFAAVPPGLNS